MTRSGRTIAVVVPALNEGHTIRAALASAIEADQLIVADGGSTDDTVEVARAYGARVIHAERGRARQMNAGARAAAGAGALVFLHADTTLPASWRSEVDRVLALPGTCAGAFRFSVGSAGLRNRLISALGGARARLSGHPFGDQAIFVETATFTTVGGFPDQPVLEDWEFIRTLKRHGHVRLARSAVVTSTRQWDDGGLLRSTAVCVAVVAGYRLGVPHRSLLAFWRPEITPTSAPCGGPEPCDSGR